MGETRHFLGNAAGSRLYMNERHSDMSIRVEWQGQRCQFPGHKLVLVTMSDVLRTMLESDMLERNSRTLTISDSTPYTVKQFLKYMYIGIVDFNNWFGAANLLRIAHKYAVHPLVQLCESYLLSQIVITNACEMYELSRTYSLRTLKKETQNFILDAGFMVSSTDGFFNLPPRALDIFLGSRLFNMENEGSVLTSLREWAVSECTRRCVSLSRANVLLAMEPFFKHIRWSWIPDNHRTFVPRHLTEKHVNLESEPRKRFFVPASLQSHMSHVKLVLELGAFHERTAGTEGLTCLKFCVDSHIFLTGFRIVGLFEFRMIALVGPSSLILSREDNKTYVQFNLYSLPWRKGTNVGPSSWQEMLAFLPYPIRVDPFFCYSLTIKGRANKEINVARWPRTRIESEAISTELGTVNIRSYGSCYGMTELFIFPAPPYRNLCDDDSQ